MLNATDFNKQLCLYKMEDKNMLIEIFCVNTVSITGPFCNAHKDVVLVQVIDSLETNSEDKEPEPVVKRIRSLEICHTVLQTSCLMGIEVLKCFLVFF